jgi:hypothetical protein
MRLILLALAASVAAAATVSAVGAEAVAKAAQRAPAPVPTNLPSEVLSLACAPTLVFEAPSTPLRVTGGQEAFVRRTYAPGDLITINGGTDNGIEVGQEYYVRRVLQTEHGRPMGRENPATVRTSGWIRVYAVDRRMSLATITHACDTINVDDYLEPFVLPQVPAISAERLPAQRENYGRILVGNDRRQAFGRGDYFIIDRGSDHGVLVGAHFVVYRDKRAAGNFLFELGEAVAVDVRPESATLQVTVSRDAFLAGDYAALRK